jgi:hypothetical protein
VLLQISQLVKQDGELVQRNRNHLEQPWTKGSRADRFCAVGMQELSS